MSPDTPTALPATSWRKSSYSTGTGNCVEVAPATDTVVIRHSKDPAAGTITFPFPAWTTFLREARDGLTSANGVAAVTTVGTDTLVRPLHAAVTLRFTEDEWSAFVAGAADGEFDVARKPASTSTDPV